MGTRAARAAAVLVLTSLARTVARADIPPPPGYVERCTVQQQRKYGEECFSFRAGYNSPAGWSDPLTGHGFTRRCQSAGASFWQEVWCRAATADAKPLPLKWYARNDPPLVSDLLADTPRREPLERCGPGDQGGGLGSRAASKPPPSAARAKDLEVSGAMDERLVAGVLREHEAELRDCCAHRIPGRRAAPGAVPEWKTVAIAWKVDDRGRATDLHVDCAGTTLDDPSVYAAMKKRIARWTFPRARAGETVVVKKRWVLAPALGEK